jgi:hypothetical protein
MLRHFKKERTKQENSKMEAAVLLHGVKSKKIKIVMSLCRCIVPINE